MLSSERQSNLLYVLLSSLVRNLEVNSVPASFAENSVLILWKAEEVGEAREEERSSEGFMAQGAGVPWGSVWL